MKATNDREAVFPADYVHQSVRGNPDADDGRAEFVRILFMNRGRHATEARDSSPSLLSPWNITVNKRLLKAISNQERFIKNMNKHQAAPQIRAMPLMFLRYVKANTDEV
jgi:hypothetical protein